jgi:hypothetical protein
MRNEEKELSENDSPGGENCGICAEELRTE